MNRAEFLRRAYPHLQKQIVESHKLWYQKYPCRVKLNDSVSYMELIGWLATRFDLLSPTRLRDRYSVRAEGRQYTIYLKSTHDVESAIRHFDLRCEEVNVAMHKQAVVSLKENKRLLIKKSLFFKTYHHRVTFTWMPSLKHPKSTLDELIDWCYHLFNFSKQNLRNNRAWLRCKQSKPTLFLLDNDDLTHVKITWNDIIDNVETVQLIKDME